MKIFVFLLLISINLLSPIQLFAENYPSKIQELIEKADQKVVCETEKPRRVGTIFYRKTKKDWLVRIFTKDGQELEIWQNDNEHWLTGYYSPDKVFYNVPGRGWINQRNVPPDDAEKFDKRLKFTRDELKFFKSCLEEKNKGIKK